VNDPPVEVSTTVQEGSPTGGASGDPHFKTWSGEHYDFHGVCDLILLKNPYFKADLGLDIHIRTKKIRQFSYISSAVLRIGEDLFELMGDKSPVNGFHYWVNGVKSSHVDLYKDDFMLLPFTISGYPITYRRLNSKQHEFTIDLGGNEKIIMKTWNELVRLDITGATSRDFGNSSGLMGTFGNGVHMARDNKSILQDVNKFGQEWQVRVYEPKLFHSVEGPQAPEQCILPSTSSLRRRLGESLITQEEAESACSKVTESDRDLCVFDVMATNDVGVVGAY
jgi:hypothetical protein